MSPATTTVTATVGVDQRTVFGLIVPIDLTTIFTGYGVLPAVISIKRQTGAWDAVGQKRTVCLSDGSTAREQLTGYDEARYFSYRVSEFTGAIHYLVRSADGAWWFDADAAGQTTIRWQYAFNPRSRFTQPVLWLLSKTLWRSYMRHVLSRAVAQLQQEALLQVTS